MKLQTLTKRTYLGEGYIHQFVNDKTKETVVVPCNKDEYESLSENIRPVLKGHTWKGSTGGTCKVDTPTTLLGKNEYCELSDKTQIVKLDRLEEKKEAGTVIADKIDLDKLEVSILK